MKIELLFVPGCPNHIPALSRLRRIMAAAAVNADIDEIAIDDEDTARILRFPGSPTIRVDGRDVDSDEGGTEGSITCRIYRNSDALGVPSIQAIRQALTQGEGNE